MSERGRQCSGIYVQNRSIKCQAMLFITLLGVLCFPFNIQKYENTFNHMAHLNLLNQLFFMFIFTLNEILDQRRSGVFDKQRLADRSVCVTLIYCYSF